MSGNTYICVSQFNRMYKSKEPYVLRKMYGCILHKIGINGLFYAEQTYIHTEFEFFLL